MIKTLGAYVKEFKRASIATPCYMILEVLMEMMIPYLMASIIDDGVNKGDMKHICVVGAGMLVIAAIGLFAGIMGGVYGAKHQQDLPVIFERECMIIFRPFPFLTLISFQQPVS